jgi:Domain of unknown function (DUF1906)
MATRRRAKCIALLSMVLILASIAEASAAGEQREVRYRGNSVTVPASWPVYRLGRDPSRCVRLDRRAVYIGSPGPQQRCPAHAVGRARAIVIHAHDGALRVTRGFVRRRIRAARTRGERSGPLRPRANASATSSYYTGLGFDACSAPSTTTLAAWSVSPYRALGVYIGGINRACSQPNLTSTWVATVIGAGWVLIPTYVGLQAPSDVCGCASINPSQAATQGVAAADDAILQASALGIGPGNPIYYDMEGYARNATNTSAVLTFLDAWTERLHTRGYVSGVYGSAASTITDLVSQYGLGYSEPDDIWIANWNGLATTDDPYVPDSYWSNHQRIHQYRGGHNETWGGVKINVDNNYLDGAVVGNASPPLRRTKLRCPKVILALRPRTVAFRIRAFNLLHCSKARKVAAGSRDSRYAASGRDRSYFLYRFRCRGRRLGSARVSFTCTRRRAKVLFVRKD